ncbi:hotdog domain-containing protein [Rhodococcus sp. B10]|uniref:3-aminobutyryl-CoA ammonia lyase n=1 Tax=Rhodococcus sp. B10 TaxID=2695876 RepID=UPI001430B2AC|nr:hotdog domain-containing protein [Rhodococcus sp. B10]NIL78364.1 3-aminobutyryl-CoA ammonia lyase [Rhodococcus sp. B10]
MTDQLTSTLRVRIGQEEAHYGGNLVEGARILKLFGDVITEIAIKTDGDEGLFVGYSDIQFLAPVYAGDFIEVAGTVEKIGNTSRTVKFEARKVVASRYDASPSAADILDEPIVVVRATGTTVIPKENSRASAVGVLAR